MEKIKEEKEFRTKFTIGEVCDCGEDAYHKIEEVLFEDDPNRLWEIHHPYSTYLCKNCFKKIMKL